MEDGRRREERENKGWKEGEGIKKETREIKGRREEIQREEYKEEKI